MKTQIDDDLRAAIAPKSVGLTSANGALAQRGPSGRKAAP